MVVIRYSDYLTFEHLERSAAVDGKGLDEAVAILQRTVQVATAHDHR